MKFLVSLLVRIAFSQIVKLKEDAQCEQWDRRLDNNSCPLGWMSWERDGYINCVQVFDKSVLFSEAHLCCEQYSGFMASLPEEFEKKAVVEAARKLPNFKNGGGVLIGGYRLNECLNVFTPQCAGVAGFRWSQYTSKHNKTGGFTFHNSVKDLNKAYTWMVTSNFTDGGNEWFAGQMDMVAWNYMGNPATPQRAMKGYACSTAAYACLKTYPMEPP
ncbi:unnamed protein product [Caenorhabditis bovis]|uniref:C-type lectin domain-containing protein n=1 Tax=Caenorhabditis bovis TaxID=2654633 RepID=A0A8S1EPK7_9PELO|nr:unnamed protein product [Caenorhabditis bovis]